MPNHIKYGELNNFFNIYHISTFIPYIRTGIMAVVLAPAVMNPVEKFTPIGLAHANLVKLKYDVRSAHPLANLIQSVGSLSVIFTRVYPGLKYLVDVLHSINTYA